MTMIPCGLIVPAAGRSERMGFPKPLLKLGGRTFLELILENDFVRRVPLRTVVVAGHYSDELQPYVSDAVQLVMNPDYERGRTGSIQCGIRALDETVQGAMIFPVDCPWIPAEILFRIHRAWQGAQEICIPSFQERRGHPPILGREFFAEILGMRKDQPLRELYAGHSPAIRHVPVDSPLILKNINTPEDYQELKREYDSSQGGR